MIRPRRQAGAIGALVVAIGIFVLPAVAHAGSGDGYFYAKHTTPIPDGHGKASLKMGSRAECTASSKRPRAS